MTGFDMMASIAGLIAREIDGKVYDENNLEFTPQLKEHWRHHVIDYRPHRRPPSFNFYVRCDNCNISSRSSGWRNFHPFMVNNIMATTSVIEQMRQLIQLIAKHNHAYYVMDQPTISDSEYDHLFHQLKALEEQYPDLVQSDSPTTKVGGQALSKFQSVTHVVPMLSLGNVFNQEDLFAFARRVEERLPNQKYNTKSN